MDEKIVHIEPYQEFEYEGTVFAFEKGRDGSNILHIRRVIIPTPVTFTTLTDYE